MGKWYAVREYSAKDDHKHAHHVAMEIEKIGNESFTFKNYLRYAIPKASL